MSEPRDSCILWNKNGSNAENTNSEIGQNGVISGVITYNACKHDNGSYSNNNANYISYAGNDLDLNKIIFECWFKCDVATTNGVCASGTVAWLDWYKSNNDRFIIFQSGTGFYVLTLVGGVLKQFQHTTGLTWGAGTLHHIIVVYNKDGIAGGANTSRVYLDGSLITTNNGATDNQTTDPALGTLHQLVYFFNGASGQNFHGTQDNIKIYNNTDQAIIDDIIANKDNEDFPSAYVQTQAIII